MNNQNIVPTGKRSVMCPRCGKLLTWVNKSDKKHHKVMCTHLIIRVLYMVTILQQMMDIFC